MRKNFNPLHREGGDAFSYSLFPHILKFQSTPPRGWRQGPWAIHRRYYGISIHSTARVETARTLGTFTISVFQSTPPRGWRLLAAQGNMVDYYISIHSTARVETLHHFSIWLKSIISIHSTARVETRRDSKP